MTGKEVKSQKTDEGSNGGNGSIFIVPSMGVVVRGVVTVPPVVVRGIVCVPTAGVAVLGEVVPAVGVCENVGLPVAGVAERVLPAAWVRGLVVKLPEAGVEV